MLFKFISILSDWSAAEIVSKDAPLQRYVAKPPLRYPFSRLLRVLPESRLIFRGAFLFGDKGQKAS